MSGVPLYCVIASAIGAQWQTCEPPQPIAVPANDSAAYVWQRPAPDPPPTPPAPRIIERTVYIEVPPPLAPPQQPQVQKKDPQPSDDDLRIMAERMRIELARQSTGQAYAHRRTGAFVAIDSPSTPPIPTGATGNAPRASASFTPPPDPLSLAPELANLVDRDEAAKYNAPSIAATLPVDNERILTADRYITGILESSVNTQIAGTGQGSIIIQTSRDVFGYHGRRILLPKGSRLICDYVAPKKIGETRIAMSCGRVLAAGHRAEIYQASAGVRDAQGRAGVTGEVDNRFWNRYGTAFLLAGISATVRGATAKSDSAGANTGEVILDEAGKELAKRFGEITASVLQETVALQPVISIPQGTRVQIRPANDWYIAKL